MSWLLMLTLLTHGAMAFPSRGKPTIAAATMVIGDDYGNSGDCYGFAISTATATTALATMAIVTLAVVLAIVTIAEPKATSRPHPLQVKGRPSDG